MCSVFCAVREAIGRQVAGGQRLTDKHLDPPHPFMSAMTRTAISECSFMEPEQFTLDESIAHTSSMLRNSLTEAMMLRKQLTELLSKKRQDAIEQIEKAKKYLESVQRQECELGTLLAPDSVVRIRLHACSYNLSSPKSSHFWSSSPSLLSMTKTRTLRRLLSLRRLFSIQHKRRVGNFPESVSISRRSLLRGYPMVWFSRTMLHPR